MKWYGDVLSVLQSAWHMSQSRIFGYVIFEYNSNHTPVIGLKSMNFSYCDLERLEFQIEKYNSIRELFLCGNVHVQNWDVLYQIKILKL